MLVQNNKEAFQKEDKVHFITTITIKSIKGTIYVIKGCSSAVYIDNQEYSISNQIKVIKSKKNFTKNRIIIIIQNLTIKLTKTQRPC